MNRETRSVVSKASFVIRGGLESNPGWSDDLILFRFIVYLMEQVRPDFQHLVLAAARLIKLPAALWITDGVLFTMDQEQWCGEGICLFNYLQTCIHDACKVLHTDFWMDKRIVPVCLVEGPGHGSSRQHPARCSGSGPA